jgi:hypothetical protein
LEYSDAIFTRQHGIGHSVYCHVAVLHRLRDAKNTACIEVAFAGEANNVGTVFLCFGYLYSAECTTRRASSVN